MSMLPGTMCQEVQVLRPLVRYSMRRTVHTVLVLTDVRKYSVIYSTTLKTDVAYNGERSYVRVPMYFKVYSGHTIISFYVIIYIKARKRPLLRAIVLMEAVLRP